MEQYTNIAFLIAGLIIVIGYIGGILFDRFRVPDILFLVGIGILIGPVTNSLDAKNLEGVTTYFGQLALVFILFEGGLGIDFVKFIKNISSGALLGFLSFTFTMLGVWVGTEYILPYIIDTFRDNPVPTEASLMLGAILGGTSSAVVIPLIQKLKIGDKTKINISLESILTDIFTVLTVIILIDIIKIGSIDPSTVLNKVAGGFTIAMFAGIVAGILWVAALRKMKQSPLSYMTTMAIALVLFALTNYAQGNGGIAVFTFALVLNNANRFLTFLGLEGAFYLDEKIGLFHKEISFFIRTYFFVLIGLHCTPDKFVKDNLIIAGILLGCILTGRWVVVYIFGLFNKEEKKSKLMYTIMFPRGLAAAIMASVPYLALKDLPSQLTSNSVNPAQIQRLESIIDFIKVDHMMAYAIIAIIVTNIITILCVKAAEKSANESDDTDILGSKDLL